MWPLSASAVIDARPGSPSADWRTAPERSKMPARRVVRGRNARARGIRTSETSSRLTAGTIDSSSGEPGTSSRAIRALTIADAWRLVKPRRSRCQDLTARGETPAAFGRRCIPAPPHRAEKRAVGTPAADCVAPPSNTPDIAPHRAQDARWGPRSAVVAPLPRGPHGADCAPWGGTSGRLAARCDAGLSPRTVNLSDTEHCQNGPVVRRHDTAGVADVVDL